MAMAATAASRRAEARRAMTGEEKMVIFASSLGTVFEWYDFYLFGTLAVIIGAQFFSSFPEATRNIFALLAFAAAFFVRPFGALVFGRLGDLVGRKYTFLITIMIMGLSTALVGFLPNYAAWGAAAPICLIILRMLQGLALGGEYGGAATYVAEHAPAGRRGFYTSWIQTTATLGLFLSILVILGTRTIVGEKAFADWYWRVPFMVSILLLGISLWIRLQLAESPAFQRMKDEGTVSKAPLSEAFGNWKNGKIAVMALFGLVAGQAVVWYTGQFYTQFFMQGTLKVDLFTSQIMVALSLAVGTWGFLIFGALSDRIGRKPIILAGCLIAAVTYFPLFGLLTKTANPALALARDTIKVSVIADPAACSFQFNPVGTAKFTSSCDIAKAALAARSVSYSNEVGAPGSVARIKIGATEVDGFDLTKLPDDAAKTAASAKFAKDLGDALGAVKYPNVGDPGIVKITSAADVFKPQVLTIVGILTLLVIYVTMVYGPIAAALVELFPTRIRYSGMSLPYHIGNGWFGGFLPALAAAIVLANGDIFAGLWYPIIIASMTFIVGLIFIPETKDRDIYAED